MQLKAEMVGYYFLYLLELPAQMTLGLGAGLISMNGEKLKCFRLEPEQVSTSQRR
jgi:hypothetical protein